MRRSIPASAKAATATSPRWTITSLHYEMLFAALGLETFHLLGASMGGHMAARYAGEHSDEIERLVLISPAGLKSDKAAIPDWLNLAPEDHRALFVESLDWLEPFWPAEPGRRMARPAPARRPQWR